MCKRRIKDKEEFPEDCDYIWSWVRHASLGIERKDVESLWEKFSTEMYFAGFMVPYDSTIIEFIDWYRERR